jgi:hypothetical protein
MSVDGILDVPYAFYCVCVTNTVCGHNIICWPTKGTSKADIRCNLSISNVAWSTCSAHCSMMYGRKLVARRLNVPNFMRYTLRQ